MARRKLIWARQPLASTTLANISAGVAGAVESQDLLNVFRTEAGLLKGPVGLTVMRIRLQISLDLAADATTTAIRNSGGVYHGIRVFDTQELTDMDVNEQVARGPVADPHADWMAWGRTPLKQINGAVSFIGWQDVDVRAMRKMEELGQSLGLVLQATSGVLGGVITGVFTSTSVLLALP